MNKDILQGNWTQFKGKAQKQWGKLTDDELDEMEGRHEELNGALQKHYGYSKEEADKAIDDFLNAA